MAPMWGCQPMLPSSGDSRLDSQLRFIVEVDRLKEVGRQSYLISGKRKENAAEHSWHVALMTLVLAEWSAEAVDGSRVAAMLLVHDVVEIDAGDTYFYDQDGARSQAQRERLAAERIFGLLPADQQADLRGLWDEYERGDSVEARFARSLDRLMPLIHNVATRGRSWREHGVTASQVRSRIRPGLDKGRERFWELADLLIEYAVGQGWLAEE